MTIETLKQCRKALHDVISAEKLIAEHKATAGSISGMRYGDTPHGRGEPLSPQEAHLEELERLQEKLDKHKRNYDQLRTEIASATADLPVLQRRLIYGYYLFGFSWETVNNICNVNRKQSQYQVKKAFEKILEKA